MEAVGYFGGWFAFGPKNFWTSSGSESWHTFGVPAQCLAESCSAWQDSEVFLSFPLPVDPQALVMVLEAHFALPQNHHCPSMNQLHQSLALILVVQQQIRLCAIFCSRQRQEFDFAVTFRSLDIASQDVIVWINTAMLTLCFVSGFLNRAVRIGACCSINLADGACCSWMCFGERGEKSKILCPLVVDGAIYLYC